MHRSLLVRVAVAAGLLLGAAPASAADIEPPRALGGTTAPYPAGGRSDARVVVEIVVDRAGVVEEALVVSAWCADAGTTNDRACDATEAAFAAGAIAASRTWRFEPARLDGRPTPARIRLEVAFRAPPAPAPPEPAGTATTPAVPPKPPPPPPRAEEVRVEGERRQPIGGSRLGNAEVRMLPGVFGDPFRAIEVLPGVVPSASAVPFYFIRGAPPGNTGYFLDGIRVPALFHLGIGPSVIHPSLIEKVDLYAGPVPAQYGRYAGGLVAGTLRPPATQAHGEANVRLFDAGALAETPFANGRGTALAAARYGYPALLLPLFSPDTRLAYWDYQGRATYDVTDRDTLGVFAFGTYDSLSQRNVFTGVFEEQLGFTFHRVDVRLDHKLRAGGKVRAALTLGYDRSGDHGIDFSKQVYGARVELDQPISKAVRVRGGWDALYEPYELETTVPAVRAAFPPHTQLFGGVWADAIVRPFPWLELQPGVRGDVYTSKTTTGTTTQAAIDPKLVARVALSKKVTWISQVGVAHQAPSTLLTLPGFDVGPVSSGLQESIQWGESVEASLPLGFSGSLGGYYNVFRGLSDATFACTPNDLTELADCSSFSLHGRAYGLELLLRRALTERISGLVSYTLSRSERVDPRWFGEGSYVPSRFDRPHVVNVILTADLGGGWSAGGRLFSYSGTPYTRLYGSTYQRTIPPYNQARLDPFTRLDLRLEKRWTLKGGARVAFVAEFLNALLQKEALGITCPWPPGHASTVNPDGSPYYGACSQTTVGPISVPSVGVEASF